mgnify:CR=1 FL=1
MAKTYYKLDPKADGFRMPGEFEEQKQIFMICRNEPTTEEPVRNRHKTLQM